jgi:hypothetical protein
MSRSHVFADIEQVLSIAASGRPLSADERAKAAKLHVALRHLRGSRARAGRPIRPEQRSLVVEGISSGLSLSAACDFVGVHSSTIYREIRRDREFAEAVETARELACDVAEERLEEIALDGPLDSMATVRAAEAVLRRRSARYR